MKKILLGVGVIACLMGCTYNPPKATYELSDNSNYHMDQTNKLDSYEGVVKLNNNDSTVYFFDFYNDNTYVVKIDKVKQDSTFVKLGSWVKNGDFIVVYGTDASAYRFKKEKENLSFINDDGLLYDENDADNHFVLYKK
jgi:hypothetical protein